MQFKGVKREDRIDILKKIMIGRQFFRLTVIDFSHRDRAHTHWVCVCSCGSKRTVTKNSLTRGRNKSCGCYIGEKASQFHRKHGMANDPIYKIWHQMISRCSRKSHSEYRNYGGRGIFVDKRWLDFKTFYSDFGQYKTENLSIDRIDNNGPYSPENCRWATMMQQQNNKRQTRKLTFNGNTKSIKEWCRLFKTPHQTAYDRINKGWTFEQCFIKKERS